MQMNTLSLEATFLIEPVEDRTEVENKHEEDIALISSTLQEP